MGKELCELCGEPMPEGETMFKFHGYSGPCPKPHQPKPAPPSVADLEHEIARYKKLIEIADVLITNDEARKDWENAKNIRVQ